MKRFFIFCLLLFTAIVQSQEVDLPNMTVAAQDDVADGVVYLATLRRNQAERNEAQRHLLVVNNVGEIVYQEPVGRVFNFGRAVNGLRYYFSFTDDGLGRGASNNGVYRMVDDSGNIQQEYTVQGDYPTQSHEFIYRDDGHVFLLSQPVIVRDLTAYGGSQAAVVSEALIQELDENNTVVWEWRSWEHLSLAETANLDELTNIPPDGVSYLHVNAFTIDLDGNLIVSARRFDELIKIDYDTGDIIWRMGGQRSRNNQFVFIGDPYVGFTGQHHVQVLPSGNILLFDNGDSSANHPARALEYRIDEDNLSATLVWSFTDVDGRSSPAMGSVQRLDNGNTLIGWGSASPDGANLTEVTSDGRIVFELTLPPTLISYRAYRFTE